MNLAKTLPEIYVPKTDTFFPIEHAKRSGIWKDGDQVKVFDTSSGGMSLIYCFDVEEQTFALKHGFDRPEKKQFMQEVTNHYLASLFTNTPNIYYAHLDNNGSAMIMDYVDGPEILEYEDNLLPVLQRLAYDLYKVHCMGIIHRDVKPSNVIVTKKGPSLLDYGISVRHEGTYRSEGDTIWGTTAFMAPESLLKSENSVLSDQYSFAALCSVVLTDKPPLPTDSIPLKEIARLHLESEGSIDREELISRGYDESLADILDRCLAKEPSERYDSMLDVCTALKKYV